MSFVFVIFLAAALAALIGELFPAYFKDRYAVSADEDEFRRHHDELNRCAAHLHMRGVGEEKRELARMAQAGFKPADLHDDRCYACKFFRKAESQCASLG